MPEAITSPASPSAAASSRRIFAPAQRHCGPRQRQSFLWIAALRYPTPRSAAVAGPAQLGRMETLGRRTEQAIHLGQDCNLILGFGSAWNCETCTTAALHQLRQSVQSGRRRAKTRDEISECYGTHVLRPREAQPVSNIRYGRRVHEAEGLPPMRGSSPLT